MKEERNKNTTAGKILLISTEFPPGPGGVGCHAHMLAVELGRLGWKLHIVTEQNYCTQEQVDEFNTSFEHPIYQMKSGPSKREILQRWRHCKKIVRQFKPDIIMGTNRRAVYFARMLAWRFSLPFVVIGHGTEFLVESRRQRFFNKMSYGSASLFISVSNFTESQVLKSGIHPKKSVVIQNGADHRQFRVLDAQTVTRFRKELDLEGRKIILSVGAIHERKGQWVVIEAMKSVIEKFPEALYIMVGRPPKTGNLQEEIDEMGLTGHVRMLGIRPAEELVLWYNACDVFAMTSTFTKQGDFEGFGIAVIEAALCGKPAVVSDNSGLKEAVVDKLTGLYTRERDASSVAEAVSGLISNETWCRDLGENARSRAEGSYTWEKVALLYQEHLGQFVTEKKNS